MQQTITGNQLIGTTESGAGKISFNSYDPKSGNPTPWSFKTATSEEINQAMEKASKAFVVLKKLPASRRATFLSAIADALEAEKASLTEVYQLESGLPEGRALGELGRTTNQLRLFAELITRGDWVEARIDTAQPKRKPVPKPDIRKCLVPLGPVVVFGASNFPFAFSTAGGDTASAFAAGCPVVVKGHPMHAATGELVARLIQKAARLTEMPEGIFSHLQGEAHEVGEALVLHPGTKAVGFTGSRNGGTALAALGRKREVPIPIFAEMGSVNPVLLLPSALKNAETWAQAYAGSVTLGAGQFCTNPGILIGIAGTEWETFTKALTHEMNKSRNACMLHANLSKNFRKQRDVLLAKPAVLKRSGELGKVEGTLVNATVAAVSGEDFIKDKSLQEEVFGPFTLLIGCRDMKRVEEVIACLEGQLTATVLGLESEMAKSETAIDLLREKAGRILFNGVPTGVEVCAAMQHGGPFPATTDSRFTSVGLDAIRRWVRPMAFQDCPQVLLPEELKDENPLGILRLVDGDYSRKKINP
ncbi:aldehyde dehydrogenase (NADP(+)) [Robiginitalea sp. IMCC43444]|uniref:aldehyde dehydrogenase (NADP(+)) n=1 Tax=Robiginitalea sp. IMCC43444 TaxID=3459121 RepID=UPI0040418C43